MAQYTTLTKQEIDTVAAEFNIQGINSFSVLHGGSENTNYLLKTENGNFVLTICEQKTTEEATKLALTLEHLEQQNFKSSVLIRTINNQPISFWGKKPILMKQFLEGTVHETLPNHLMEFIGAELGKLHQVKTPDFVTHQLNFGKEQFINVRKYAADTPFEAWLNERLANVTPYFDMGLPKALIHSDIFCNNVVISHDEQSVTIMDFEEAVLYYRVFDIGMTFIGSCREGETLNREKVKAVLKGYSKEIQLSTTEIDALQAFTVYAGAAMTFWRHINFNYTEPTPDLFDHYLGLKVITDFIEAQPKDYFQRIIEEFSIEN